MADGTVHNGITEQTAVILTLGTVFITGSVTAGIAICLGTLSGKPLTPDLDILPQTKRWNTQTIPKRLWRLYWKPYAYFIPHRHPLSHAPVIGTFFRVCYLFPILAIFLLIGEAVGLPVLTAVSLGSKWLFFVFSYAYLGLNCADLMHWIIDKAGEK